MLCLHEDDTVVKCSKRKSISRNSESLDSHIAKCNKKKLNYLTWYWRELRNTRTQTLLAKSITPVSVCRKTLRYVAHKQEARRWRSSKNACGSNEKATPGSEKVVLAIGK